MKVVNDVAGEHNELLDQERQLQAQLRAMDGDIAVFVMAVRDELRRRNDGTKAGEGEPSGNTQLDDAASIANEIRGPIIRAYLERYPGLQYIEPGLRAHLPELLLWRIIKDVVPVDHYFWDKTIDHSLDAQRELEMMIASGRASARRSAKKIYLGNGSDAEGGARTALEHAFDDGAVWAIINGGVLKGVQHKDSKKGDSDSAKAIEELRNDIVQNTFKMWDSEEAKRESVKKKVEAPAGTT